MKCYLSYFFQVGVCLNIFYFYLQVGDPYYCTKISNELIERYSHYVQAINRPTVPLGEEKLRIAPTPFHSKPLMDKFVVDLVDTWKHVGLPLREKRCNEVRTVDALHNGVFCQGLII